MTAINFFTRKEYGGRNALTLGAGEYATFLQWRDGGYKVRKGEKGAKIVKVLQSTKTDKNTDKKKTVRGLRYYTVFSKAQVERVA